MRKIIETLRNEKRDGMTEAVHYQAAVVVNCDFGDG